MCVVFFSVSVTEISLVENGRKDGNWYRREVSMFQSLRPNSCTILDAMTGVVLSALPAHSLKTLFIFSVEAVCRTSGNFRCLSLTQEHEHVSFSSCKISFFLVCPFIFVTSCPLCLFFFFNCTSFEVSVETHTVT